MWCEGPVWSRVWRLPTPPLRFALHLSLILLCLGLSFMIAWYPCGEVIHCRPSDLLSYWTRSGVMELPSFRHFVKSGVTRDDRAGIWTEGSSEPSTCTIYTNSLDLLSELSGLDGHPVGDWRNCMLFLETPQIWCRKPRLILPVLWELRWVLGTGE